MPREAVSIVEETLREAIPMVEGMLWGTVSMVEGTLGAIAACVTWLTLGEIVRLTVASLSPWMDVWTLRSTEDPMAACAIRVMPGIPAIPQGCSSSSQAR